MSYHWGIVPSITRPMHLYSFLLPTCRLSTVLMTDQDLLQSSWDYVTTIMTFSTNSMKNSSFLASSQHPLRSNSVSETKRLRFLYCCFHPAKLRAKPCVCRVAFSCLLCNIQTRNRVLKVERLQNEQQGHQSRCLYFCYIPFHFLYSSIGITFCSHIKPI